MGVSILGGVIWSRANRWGAIASLVAALTTNFSLYYVRDQRLDHWDADVFFLSLLAGAITLVVVSLLTPPEAREKTDEFFGRLQTPTGLPGQSDSDDFEGISRGQMDQETMQKYAKDGHQSLLVNLLNLRKGTAGLGFWRAYHGDLKGFIIGCGLAAALVFCTWLFLKF